MNNDDKLFQLTRDIEDINEQLNANQKKTQSVLLKVQKLTEDLNKSSGNEKQMISEQIRDLRLSYQELAKQKNLLDQQKLEAQKAYQELASSNNFEGPLDRKKAFEEGLKMMDQLKGFPKVQDKIDALIKVKELEVKRNQLGLNQSIQANNLVFAGGNSAERSLVARAISKMYFGLGVCKEDRFIETNRESLVAGYVGQTALQTREVIEKAFGGVIYIDEIQSLVKGGALDFGQEALYEILVAMENHRSELVIIIGGEKEGLHSFLESNVSIGARFKNIISFDN